MSKTIVVLHVPNVVAALERYPDIARTAYETAAHAALMDTIPTLAHYPPKPPTSRYRRTGTLGRLWTTARPEFDWQTREFTATLANNTPYAEYVQSAQRQARVHRDRWRTVDDILQSREQRILSFFDAAARKIEREIKKALPE